MQMAIEICIKSGQLLRWTIPSTFTPLIGLFGVLKYKSLLLLVFVPSGLQQMRKEKRKEKYSQKYVLQLMN